MPQDTVIVSRIDTWETRTQGVDLFVINAFTDDGQYRTFTTVNRTWMQRCRVSLVSKRPIAVTWRDNLKGRVLCEAPRLEVQDMKELEK